MTAAGLRSLDWLAALQRSDDGYFAPVGSERLLRARRDEGARSTSSRWRPARWCRRASRRGASDRRRALGAPRAPRLRLVPRPERPAAARSTTDDRRVPRRPPRRPRQRESGRRVDALVPARAARDARRRRVDESASDAQSARHEADARTKSSSRHGRNPILTAADWPYPAHTVFNPGATKLADGTTLLLCRVEDRRGLSHLCAARSTNGVDGWVIDPEPTLRARSGALPRGALGHRGPAHHVRRRARQVRRRVHRVQPRRAGRRPRADRGLPDLRALRARDAARRQGRGAAAPAHRRELRARAPADDGLGRARVDLVLARPAQLGRPQADAPARKGAWWDANKVGLSPPLIETPRGWLMLYHGVRPHGGGRALPAGGGALRARPAGACAWRAATRGSSAPRTPYEREGDVGNVVLPLRLHAGRR